MKMVSKALARPIAPWILLLGLGGTLRSADLTAFDLIRLGNDYVGKDAQNRVVQIRSERSVAGLTPAVWYVAYYDPDATFRITEVKFGAGKKLQAKRPARVWGRIEGTQDTLDPKRMKVDSDRALQIALKEPLLEKLTVKATKLLLDRAGDAGQGDRTLPAWRVDLWAAKLANPNRLAYVGHIWLSADDGKVLVTDLNISRVD